MIAPITAAVAVVVSGAGTAELAQLAMDAHYFAGATWGVATLVHSGAKLACRRWGAGWRWRLNGYAQNGSDVEVAS